MAGRPPISRDVVLRAARTAFLAGGPTTQLEDVRRIAGIGHSTLHRVCGSRAALISDLLIGCQRERLERLSSVFAAADSTPAATVAAVIESMLTWALAEPRTGTLLAILTVAATTERIEQPAHPDFRQREVTIMDAWAAPLVQQGSLRPLPSGVMHAVMFAPLEALLRTGAVDNDPQTLRDYTQILAAVTWDALRAPPSVPCGRDKPRHGRHGQRVPADTQLPLPLLAPDHAVSIDATAPRR